MSQRPTQICSTADVVESFFGVYLLYSLNPKYKGRTYIGYTVNPNRRINQHNKGSAAGGARRTNNRGPWEMVLIVHGFPNDISALRFEWAWQNPKRSRRLRNVQRKKPKEKQYQYCLRILLEMLRMGPWNKLPLTIRWLAEEFHQDFQADLSPPMHMPITIGLVCAKKVQSDSNSALTKTSDNSDHAICALCRQPVMEEDALCCIVPRCQCTTHIFCLAQRFLGNSTDTLLPVEGTCPRCHSQMLWGDLIRKKKGCYQSITDSPS